MTSMMHHHCRYHRQGAGEEGERIVFTTERYQGRPLKNALWINEKSFGVNHYKSGVQDFLSITVTALGVRRNKDICPRRQSSSSVAGSQHGKERAYSLLASHALLKLEGTRRGHTPCTAKEGDDNTASSY